MAAESKGEGEGVPEDVGESSEDSEGLDEFDNYGYEAVDRSCKMIYPDQPNPLQSMPVIKIWLGGPDPIDFIRMYSNEGDLSKYIPPHWHYITFGFSDLYGDERVHRRVNRGEPSGFGFELTFRLKKQPDDTVPPAWPINLINRLARYVFQTGNCLHVGDHIPWHSALDSESESQVKHMLVSEDPQLLDLDTPYGTVEFRQVVGVMEEELKAAQKWKGAGMLELLYKEPDIGPFFVTDLERDKSIFEKKPDLQAMVTEGIDKDGSNLGHVTALFQWSKIMSDGESSIEKSQDEKSSEAHIKSQAPAESESSQEGAVCGSDDNKENIYTDTSIYEEEEEEEELQLESIDAVHLQFDAEAAELLPMVVRGRLKKGRFFIFRNADCAAVHLVPADGKDESVFVDEVDQMQVIGTDLQIYCSATFIDEMSEAFEELQTLDESVTRYPKEFRFSHPSVLVTVYPRGQISTTGETTAADSK